MRLRIALVAVLTTACIVAAYGPSAEPRWWKGNTHAHTLWSDGDGAPELVSSWYRDAGYHFLVLSDHDVLAQGEKWVPVGQKPTVEHVAELKRIFGEDGVDLRTNEDGSTEMRLLTLAEVTERFESPGEFLFISGEEISPTYEETPVHVNGLNLAEPIEPPVGTSVLDTLQRCIDAVVEQGRRLDRPVLAHVNHPNFKWALTAEDLASLRGERFFEVYNGHPLVANAGDFEHIGTERMWDVALAQRLGALGTGPLFGLATDDAHNYFETGLESAAPGRGWIMVRAERLDAGSLIEAMHRGDFYASSGVTLSDVTFDGRRLAVEIAAEDGVDYRTLFIGTRAATEGGEPRIGAVLAESEENPAVYELNGDELYVRSKVVSSRLHPNPHAEGDMECAWTQPVTP